MCLEQLERNMTAQHKPRTTRLSIDKEIINSMPFALGINIIKLLGRVVQSAIKLA